MMKQIEINRADLKPGDLVVTANTGNPYIFVQREVPAPKVGDIVRTEQELEDLPRRSVILDDDGDAWQKCHGDWAMADTGSTNGRSSYSLADSAYGPYKIIHINSEEN